MTVYIWTSLLKKIFFVLLGSLELFLSKKKKNLITIQSFTFYIGSIFPVLWISNGYHQLSPVCLIHGLFCFFIFVNTTKYPNICESFTIHVWICTSQICLQTRKLSGKWKWKCFLYGYDTTTFFFFKHTAHAFYYFF